MREPAIQFYREHEILICSNVTEPAACVVGRKSRIVKCDIDFYAVEKLAVEFQFPKSLLGFRWIKVVVERWQIPAPHPHKNLLVLQCNHCSLLVR